MRPMISCAIATAIAVLPDAATAGQPYSKSMAECAGLFEALSQWTPDQSARVQIEGLADDWFRAARDQAGAEGIADPLATVTAQAIARRDAWQEKGRSAIFSEDLRDWGAYCRAFGRARGLPVYD